MIYMRVCVCIDAHVIQIWSALIRYLQPATNLSLTQ